MRPDLLDASLTGLLESLESSGIQLVMAGHTAACEVALFRNAERATSDCLPWTEGLEQSDITLHLASVMSVLVCARSEMTITFPCPVRLDSQVAWHPSPALAHVFALEGAERGLLLMDARASIPLLKGWSARDIGISQRQTYSTHCAATDPQSARFLQKVAWSPDGSTLLLAGPDVVRSIRFSGGCNVPGRRSTGCVDMAPVLEALNRKIYRSSGLLATARRVLHLS